MDFENPEVYGDTSIADGLVNLFNLRSSNTLFMVTFLNNNKTVSSIPTEICKLHHSAIANDNVSASLIFLTLLI